MNGSESPGRDSIAKQYTGFKFTNNTPTSAMTPKQIKLPPGGMLNA
jgi:hypothetical protein